VIKKQHIAATALLCSAIATGMSQAAETTDDLGKRLDALAADNAKLQQRIEQLEAAIEAERHASVEAESTESAVKESNDSFIGFDHKYAYDVLDSTTNINRKQEMILLRKQQGELGADTFSIGGAVTAIVDAQHSNTPDKFGYLMRHPTAGNQRTKDVSEAVVHSAQFEMTASLGDWTNVYLEYLYDPEQSFGAGTITALARNQVQLRQGYVLFGNLNESPFYAALGKMSTPFGLTDTVNPFTASTVWHAFGGLAYGVKGGYSKDGVNVRMMAIQGGAQFRGANVPVDDSNVPSKLNNFAFDASYTAALENSGSFQVGSSYTKGSAYCQGFPVTHFSACSDSNAAYDVYAKLATGQWQFQAEFAKTLDVWEGTFNPTIPQYEASKVTSWDVGAKYRAQIGEMPVDWSFDFSRFISGPSDAPWHYQNQWVFGAAGYLTDSTKLFMELIHTEGYAPLNFISGGNLGPGVTHSDADARSNIIVLGANVAF